MNLEGRAKVYAIAQAVISSLGFLSGIIGAGFLLLFGLLGGSIDPETGAEAGLMMVIGWTSLLIALAFIPGIISAIFYLTGKPMPTVKPGTKNIFLGALVLLWIVSVVVVMVTDRFQALNLITSLFILPLVLVPILIFFSLGSHNLSIGNQRRAWGAIAFNFSITMPLVLMVELIVFIGVFIVAAFWLMSEPELLTQIMQYSDQLSSGALEMVEAEQLLADLISRPVILNGSILVIAVLIPLIEELLKPMAIWFLAGKHLTPAQGFVGGLIGGACFAMLESLGAVGIPADSEWLVLLFGRTGTGLLHIALSGLVGWGLASAFYEQNWGRAILTYLGAVTIHGLWNFFALIAGITPVLPMVDEMGSFPNSLGQVSVFVMIALFIINMVLLVSVNRQLQQKAVD